MTVEVGAGVIYRWFDVREDQLENIEPWTEVAKKIREITGDALRIAIEMSPEGPPRTDQARRIVYSHYQAAGIKRTGKSYSQVIGNRAPHALWVHEGTLGATGRFVVAHGRGMGPVELGTLSRQVRLPENIGWWKIGSAGSTDLEHAFFLHFTFRGQKGNPWLDRAGVAAYRRPGNH